MRTTLVLTLLAAALVCDPAWAAEKKKAARKKAETGASCKAPAVGRCAACSITCPPGETAACSPGQAVADTCHNQPACRCERR